jgi:hypothetical protein
MSALPPKADMFSVETYVCFVPQGEIGKGESRASSPSDNLAKVVCCAHGHELVAGLPTWHARSFVLEAPATIRRKGIDSSTANFSHLPTMRLVGGSALSVFLVIISYQFGVPMGDFIAQYLPVGFDVLFKCFVTLQLASLLAFFAFLFVPGAFRSTYGRELLLITQGCEINSQSAPDSIDRQSEFQSASESTPTNWGVVITLHQAEGARRGLRHGLYDNPQCAERIVGWLQFELASRGTMNPVTTHLAATPGSPFRKVHRRSPP